MSSLGENKSKAIWVSQSDFILASALFWSKWCLYVPLGLKEEGSASAGDNMLIVQWWPVRVFRIAP